MAAARGAGRLRRGLKPAAAAQAGHRAERVEAADCCYQLSRPAVADVDDFLIGTKNLFTAVGGDKPQPGEPRK
jgi:hypothetical protein